MNSSVGQRAARQNGITLIEATVVLMVTSILVAAAAPIASRTLDSARLTRAQADIDAIATAIHNMLTEFTAFTPFTDNGLSTGTTMQLLVSDGDIPYLTTGGSALWDDVVDPDAAAPVDFLERHLVTNTPAGTPAGTYATGTPGWRGAYLNAPVDSDPWGNRYGVNVLYLRTAQTNDTYVLTAGPDELVATSFTRNGAFPGGDDLISIVRRDAGLVVP